jgi:hypothetical protein
VHKSLVNPGASSNVRSYFVCQRINVVPSKCTIIIIQLDRFDLKVMDELKDVMIREALYP